MGQSRADATTFVVRHQFGLQRWLRALGCPPEQAEEHCQDALLAALHEGVHERPSGIAAAWLKTAARNLFWMQLRRDRRRPPVTAIDEVETVWQAVLGDRDGGDLALEALRSCLAAADARDRALLERRYRDDETRQAIAGALGLGVAGVKQALRRARGRLQQCIESKLARQARMEV